MAGRPELQECRKHLLAELLAYYKEFIDQHGHDPSVAAALLGLSERQKKELRARPGRGGRGPRDRDAGQGNERVMRILTPEQRERWKALQGEPFRGDVRLGPPPPRHR